MKKPATPLAAWMKDTDRTTEALAEEVKRDRTRVTRWRNGDGTPDIEALARLEVISGGLITAKSFVETAQ